MARPGLRRTGSFLLCAVAYVVALAAAIATGFAVPLDHPVWVAGAADLVATLVIFAFSLRFDNSSLYDPYWSVAPPLLGCYFLSQNLGDVDPVRAGVCLGLCTAWAVRLTYNWGTGWSGLGQEDWRYVEIHRKTGKLYWLVSFLGIHLFPTAQVFAGSLALLPALTSARPFHLLDAAAVLVTTFAIACEEVADRQLRAFRRRPGKPSNALLCEGLWRYSRHPNYFGEVTFWWGLFLFGLAASPEAWKWTVVGPTLITLMFLFVSIPLMEKRQRERKPGFRSYAETTSMLVPWFPRR
jgi:steroid 5-alpha reductase family enzyme